MKLLGAKKIMHDCKALLINNLINYKHQQKQRLILQKLSIDFYIRADKPEKVTWNLDLFNFVKVYTCII